MGDKRVVIVALLALLPLGFFAGCGDDTRRQSPVTAAGTRTALNGLYRVRVPNVVGLRVRPAADRIRRASLCLNEIRAVGVGTRSRIVGQRPPAGSMVRRSTHVFLRAIIPAQAEGPGIRTPRRSHCQ